MRNVICQGTVEKLRDKPAMAYQPWLALTWKESVGILEEESIAQASDRNAEEITDKNWQVIINTLENIKNEMNIHCEKYHLFYTEHYWNGIKISNRNHAFRDRDVKLMEDLCEYSETMMVYAKQISALAQDVLEHIHSLRCADDWEGKLVSEQIIVVKNKMDILQKINLYYTQELETYVKCLQVVEKVLRSDKKISVFKRIKHFITENRVV